MSTTTPQGTFLGHPKGLFVLFFTEMWERFNYYGMRALLMLYMVNFFKWNQADSSKIYKWFTGLCYLTPLIGGFLADKYLGNKWAIILGASIMALGQFCMTVPNEQVFYCALVIVVIGNGLFKPNMATQVGRLYPPNDARRDSAYTIFYMGINLGAFIAPILCAELRDRIGFHAGFTAAGVGMLIGLFTYLFFIKWVREAGPDDRPVLAKTAQGSEAGTGRFCPHCGEPIKREAPSSRVTCFKCGRVTEIAPRQHGGDSSKYMTEEEANRSPSLIPNITNSAPGYLLFLGIAAIVVATTLGLIGKINANDAVAYGAGIGVACFLGTIVLRHIHGAARDRVLTIYLLGMFVIFFWGAFEQAGNAMNIFADKTTNRYITQPMPPEVYPPLPGGSTDGATISGFAGLWNPVKTEWFQSINALAIFVLAPIFAWLWVWLPRKGISLSIPAKMALGIFLQGMGFALMIWVIRYENQPSSAELAALPIGLEAEANGRVIFRDSPDLGDEKWQEKIKATRIDPKHAGIVNGGRITFDATNKSLRMTGVLSDTDRDRIVRAGVPETYLAKVRELAQKSRGLAKDGDAVGVSVPLDPPPPGFDLRYAGFTEKQVHYDDVAKMLSTRIPLADRDHKSLLVAGAEPNFRSALGKLYVDSARYKVSSQWLLWFFIISTLGELCLSPVGLSMVSKLAPKSYGTMLMGTWHVMIFFGNYSAGLLGESYGSLHPASYFAYITVALTVVSFLCFLLVKKMRAMMHGVM